jgi:two-component system LytT family response regulator
VINLEHVVKYLRGKGGEITMSDGTTIPVSPQKKDALLEKFDRGR